MRKLSPRGLGSMLVAALLAASVVAYQRPLHRLLADGPPGALMPGGIVTGTRSAAPVPVVTLDLDLSGLEALAPAEAGAEATGGTAHPDFLTVDLEPKAGALADPRFASVVLIEPQRGFGSGFYVAPNWILTNAHVVGKADVVSVTSYDGAKVEGHVMRSDLERDLTLVRVDHPGQPVALYNGSSLRIGSPVEAIGHPEGFSYSLSRGVVSAVRRYAGVAGVERRKVLHIQTDVVINLGNSGGPLFLGDRVVGINAWRWGNHSGLSFAVHYREVLDFLAESAALPGLVAQNGF
jgi:S1-C subfamily serine protease